MVDMILWQDMFLQKLDACFGERVWFVGLQGSYGRGEATESSDIDMVVILDELTTDDIKAYDTMLAGMPHRELICGFISGKAELMNWEPSDLFQFCNDTAPIIGSLDGLLAVIDAAAVKRAIKTGACNIYHGCVHNMLHKKNEDMVRGLYKSASFVVQALAFIRTGRYIKRQAELPDFVEHDDREIVDTYIMLKSGEDVRFEEMSGRLFRWAGKLIKTI